MNPYTMSDAEAEFTAASASGDLARIDAASARIDELDKPRPVASLYGAALWYVEQGLWVFPLTPRSKIPLKGSNGCHGASSDPDVIAGWWESDPDANIGIATGHLVDVIDIDGLEGQQTRVAHWEDIFARADADCVAKVLTPRQGGMHLYVPPTGDSNGAKILPGIDYRGANGYVVAPPSRTPEGTYRFLGIPNFSELGG